jgi:hypothetical protein
MARIFLKKEKKEKEKKRKAVFGTNVEKSWESKMTGKQRGSALKTFKNRIPLGFI